MVRTGRPRIEIDQHTFEGLCAIQCTLAEISGVLRCSEDTVERWCQRTYKKAFADVFKIYSAGGKISVRRSQFEMAKHSVPMAIWLGKQYLGQREQQAVVVTGDDKSSQALEEYLSRAKENDS